MTDNARQNIRILAHTSQVPAVKSALSRRGFFSVAALAGATAVLAACSSDSSSSASVAATGGDLEDSLNIFTWGDYDDPEVIDAFGQNNGVKITLDSMNSNEEMIAKLTASKGTSGYDIVVPTGVYIAEMAKAGLLTELNLDLIPNIAHVDPLFLGQDWDPENQWSICKNWGTLGYVYDTTVIDDDMQTWQDFIDVAMTTASKKTTVNDDPTEVVGLYYWANGIDWRTTNVDDVDACEDFMVNTFAQHLAAFESYPSTAVIPQATAALAMAWNGEARLALLSESDPDRWKWVFPGPRTELWMDNWSIAAGAPHPEAAHAFINDILTPENSLKELDYIGYNTGGKDIEAAAEELGVEMPELIFFDAAQVETMDPWELTDMQQRTVDIVTKMKAAAGA